MAGLMGICVFVILGLIAYITTRHLKVCKIKLYNLLQVTAELYRILSVYERAFWRS